MDAGRDLNIRLVLPKRVIEVTGSVLSVEVIKDANPIGYEIIMKVTTGFER